MWLKPSLVEYVGTSAADCVDEAQRLGAVTLFYVIHFLMPQSERKGETVFST